MAKDTSTQQTTNCGRCTRPLSSAKSIARGYGAGCWAKVRAARAAATGYKTHQVATATEAIEDGAVIPARRNVFLVVSSDGTEVYKTATTGQCNCAAGLKGRHQCWHTLAVQMLTGATVSVARPVHALAA